VVIPVSDHDHLLWGTLEIVDMLQLPHLLVNDGDGCNLTTLLVEDGRAVKEFSKNRGVGAAIQEGLMYAAEGNFQGVVTFDADRAYDAVALAQVVSAANKEPSRPVLGTRLGHVGERWVPAEKVAANRFAAALFFEATGYELSDVACGLRYLPTSLAAVSWREQGFGWVYESLYYLLNGDLAPRLEPVNVRYERCSPLLTSRRELHDFLDVIGKIASFGPDMAQAVRKLRSDEPPQEPISVELRSNAWHLDYVPSRDAFIVTELSRTDVPERNVTDPSSGVVAIIPDGARRWARREHVSIVQSCRISLEEIIRVAGDAGEKVENLLIYCLSRANLRREWEEVDPVLRAVASVLDSFRDHRWRPLFVGHLLELPEWFREVALETNRLTASSDRAGRLALLFVGYSSEWEVELRDGRRTPQEFALSPEFIEAMEQLRPSVILRSGGMCTLSDMAPLLTARGRLIVREELFNDVDLGSWFAEGLAVARQLVYGR
jgi:undecaprenyl diphosphate synthase